MKSKPINLGRIWNKYIIVDILCYACDKDALEQSSELLHKVSKNHRDFLVTNRAWYYDNLNFDAAYMHLKILSKELCSSRQAEQLIKEIEACSSRIHSVSLLMSGTRDGWKFEESIREEPDLLAIIRSTSNILIASVKTSIKRDWDSGSFLCNLEQD